jgi:hypothetical protein
LLPESSALEAPQLEDDEDELEDAPHLDSRESSELDAPQLLEESVLAPLVSLEAPHLEVLVDSVSSVDAPHFEVDSSSASALVSVLMVVCCGFRSRRRHARRAG